MDGPGRCGLLDACIDRLYSLMSIFDDSMIAFATFSLLLELSFMHGRTYTSIHPGTIITLSKILFM